MNIFKEIRYIFEDFVWALTWNNRHYRQFLHIWGEKHDRLLEEITFQQNANRIKNRKLIALRKSAKRHRDKERENAQLDFYEKNNDAVMRLIEARLSLQYESFWRKTGDKPTNLFLGVREYGYFHFYLRLSTPFVFDPSQNKMTWRGCQIFKVDADSHSSFS